jgi:hypothetical protein
MYRRLALASVLIALTATATLARAPDREMLDRRERARTWVPAPPPPVVCNGNTIAVIRNGVVIPCNQNE